jgi:hypothetical protein
MKPHHHKTRFHRFLLWLKQWLRRFTRLFHRSRSIPLRPTIPISFSPPTSTQTDKVTSNQTINSMSGNAKAIGAIAGDAYIDSIILQLPPQEILFLQNFWENWSQDTDPPFSPSLVIGGREESRDRVLSWLRGSPSAFTLQGDSSEEAIAFLAAVVQNLEEEERTSVLSRAVVVDGPTAWQTLITSSEPRILIARLNQPEGVGQAIKRGHHVFIPVGRMGEGDEVLPRIVRDAAEQALGEMKPHWEQASDLATLARRSLPALRRKLAIAQSIQHPAWAQPHAARELLAPLLVSVWNDACPGDRDALSQLADMPYETLQPLLVRWAHEPDPPLRRVGDTWMMAAQEDAWRLIARYLTPDDLQRFERVAIDILSELNPALELPPDQRYAASIYGKVLTRSGHLRNGVAETLALMATLSPETPFMANRTGEAVAHSIVWQLLEQAKDNATLWASLADQLPLLAEAAPDVLLQAVEAGLAGATPILASLFQDQTTNAAFMSSSPHTYLLWALETLAWNPAYLSSAALSLARLARLDPGGALANRPIHSLRDIFIFWYPNTTASLEHRLHVLDIIRRQEPAIAWNLLMQLLPQQHSTVSPTHGTKWRDWTPDSRCTPTVQEFMDATNAILGRLLSDAQTNPARWCNLIVSAGALLPEQQEVLLQHLESLEPTVFSAHERAQICSDLRKETVRHRDFSQAEWAMPAEFVHRLEAIYTRFEPEEPSTRYGWLFSYRVELPGMHGIPWSECEEAVENLRAEALQHILKRQGWQGVLALVEQVKEPALVGSTLGRSDLLPIDLGVFLQDNLGAPEPWRNQMAQRFTSLCANKYGEPWIEACLLANSGAWNPDQYGQFLLCLPFSVSLFDRLDALPEEIQRYFWSHVQHIGFLYAIYIDRLLTRLIEFSRPHLAVVNVLQWAIEHAPETVSSERIAEILEVSVQTPPGPNFDAQSFAYYSAELFNYLEKTDLSRDRLASLELRYLTIHKHYRRPRILYGELSRNPEVFVEALRCIFPAENEPPEEPSGESQTAALAWEFLKLWKQMPGVQEDGSVEAEALCAWVMRARELAAESDRSHVADIYIGQALAFSPMDSDGAWPHQAVRNLIEELANSDVESGWHTQTFNNRGITMRSPTDGGEQERLLVRQYDDYARQITDRWPRTAAVLREMAGRYHRQSTEEDQRAELTQDFWR